MGQYAEHGLDTEAIGQLLDPAAWPAVTELWLGLSTAQPLVDGSDFFEDLDAARTDVTGLFAVTLATPVLLSNPSEITTQPMPAGTYTHAFLADAETDGMLLLTIELTDDDGNPFPATVGDDIAVTFPAEALTFSGTE